MIMKNRSVVGVCVVLGAVAVARVEAQDPRCSKCGPGANWVDSCAAGTDSIDDHGAVLGIDTDLDCIADTNLVLSSCGTLEILRSAPAGGVIDTEIVDLCLSGGGITLIAGAGNGAIPLAPSPGQIVEDTGDNTLADSFYNVFFEVDLGGGSFAYNQTPVLVQDVINCVPPKAKYIHVNNCIPLFDDPTTSTNHVANLVRAEHDTFLRIPAMSTWGAITMVGLLLVAGTLVFGGIRSNKGTVNAA